MADKLVAGIKASLMRRYGETKGWFLGIGVTVLFVAGLVVANALVDGAIQERIAEPLAKWFWKVSAIPAGGLLFVVAVVASALGTAQFLLAVRDNMPSVVERRARKAENPPLTIAERNTIHQARYAWKSGWREASVDLHNLLQNLRDALETRTVRYVEATETAFNELSRTHDELGEAVADNANVPLARVRKRMIAHLNAYQLAAKWVNVAAEHEPDIFSVTFVDKKYVTGEGRFGQLAFPDWFEGWRGSHSRLYDAIQGLTKHEDFSENYRKELLLPIASEASLRFRSPKEVTELSRLRAVNVELADRNKDLELECAQLAAVNKDWREKEKARLSVALQAADAARQNAAALAPGVKAPPSVLQAPGTGEPPRTEGGA